MPASLRGASRASLLALREQLEGLVGDADAETVSRQLFDVVDLLDGQPTLRRALTDPARNSDDRTGLATGLFGGRLGEAATAVAARAAGLGWARTRDLSDAIETAAVLVAVADSDRRGRLDAVEDQLFEVGAAIDENPDLASALSDPAAPMGSKTALVGDLLDGADPAAVDLAQRAVLAPRAGTVTDTIGDFARIAAELRRRLVATVESATQLSDGQRERLRSALSRQYGRDVHLNILVEPDVVGGIAVTVGDDIIDGTIRTRITDVSRLLAR